MAELTRFTDWPWQHWASLQPNAIALLTDDSSLTWLQLAENITALANDFYQQGLRNNQTVALRGKNNQQLLLSQLAVLRCGAKVLPLNPQLPELLLKDLLPHLNIDFFIDFSSGVVNSYSSLELQPIGFADVNLSQTHHLPCFSDVIEQPATLVLTSGSTGLPKAAVHSMAVHLNSAEGVVSVMNYHQGDCWLLSLPLFHVSGQGIVWRWLLQGGRIALKNSPLVGALHGVTHASLVPTQLWRLLNDEIADNIALKEVLLGGAVIPTTLTDLAESYGIACWSGYGMTEMASTVCAKRADGKRGVGLPLKGKQVRIVGDEIQIQSSSQALGYWFDGVITPLNTLDGWFRTNDKGAFIDGEYQILGRLDNLFISGGECVQPEDIEAVINRHPAVEQCFIIPVDDNEFGQRGVAVVDVSDAQILSEIAAWLKGKLTSYQFPVHFYQLENHLKKGGIKVSRKQVTDWVLQQ